MRSSMVHFLVLVNQNIQTILYDDLFLLIMGNSLPPVSSTTSTCLYVLIPKTFINTLKTVAPRAILLQK